jgi:WD40 repeat protein
VFHPTLPFLITGSPDATAKIWHFLPNSYSSGITLTCMAILNGHSDGIWSIAFHPSGLLLATGSADKTVKLWCVEQDGTAVTCIATMVAHKYGVRFVNFHPTKPFLRTYDSDNIAILWQYCGNRI